jgi:hypothetical protein
MEQEVVNDSSLSLAKGDNTSEDERKGRYKPSYYNFLFDAEDGTHLIYNTMSGGFAAVNDEEFADLKLILDDPNGFQSDTERKTQLFQSAIHGGYSLSLSSFSMQLLLVYEPWAIARRTRQRKAITLTMRLSYKHLD